MSPKWTVVAAVCFLSLTGLTLAADKKDSWESYRFLMGEWVAEGDGHPGKGSGGFSFSPDLDGKILVRKSHNDIPAANGRPAIKHEDLLIVYRGGDGRHNQAVFFDNEDHVIQYTVTFSINGKSLSFVSDAAPKAPRFRLTYTALEDGNVGIKFEIAPPGSSETFRTYLTGKARRTRK